MSPHWFSESTSSSIVRSDAPLARMRCDTRAANFRYWHQTDMVRCPSDLEAVRSAFDPLRTSAWPAGNMRLSLIRPFRLSDWDPTDGRFVRAEHVSGRSILNQVQ